MTTPGPASVGAGENTVALVTGATSGIGRETARGLARTFGTVVLTGRDRERGEQVRETLASETGATVDLRLVDFADLGAVRVLADGVREDHDRLDALVNNAGTYRRHREVTAEGVEATFLVNHLAPFLLTHRLADRLATCEGRVVTVASALEARGRLDLDDLAMADYDPMAAYARSKLANVLFTFELAARLEGTGATANAVHPGTVPSTRLTRDSSLRSRLLFGALRLLPGVTTTPAEAADAVVSLATASDVPDVTGTYFDGREPDRTATDEERERARRLWTASADLVGVDPELPVDRD